MWKIGVFSQKSLFPSIFYTFLNGLFAQNCSEMPENELFDPFRCQIWVRCDFLYKMCPFSSQTEFFCIFYGRFLKMCRFQKMSFLWQIWLSPTSVESLVCQIRQNKPKCRETCEKFEHATRYFFRRFWFDQYLGFLNQLSTFSQANLKRPFLELRVSDFKIIS